MTPQRHVNTLHEPVRDRQTVARLAARYPMEKVVRITLGMDPATAADIEAWRLLGGPK